MSAADAMQWKLSLHVARLKIVSLHFVRLLCAVQLLDLVANQKRSNFTPQERWVQACTCVAYPLKHMPHASHIC